MSARLAAHEQGLSLIELLLGLAITALVMAPLVPMLQTATSAARISDDQVSLEREADFALERIAARIRATAPPPANDLRDKPDSEWLKPAVYQVSAGALLELQGTEIYPLTGPDSVTAFSLGAPAVNGQALITVSLSMQRGAASTTAAATVRMGSAR